MKLYKSVTDNTAKCKTFIDLQNNSFFVFLPDSNACSPGTRYKQGTFLSMQKGASAVLVDWYSSGAQVIVT